MKTHKTVTLTRDMLAAEGACDFGLREVASLLPAEVSTNPEDNLDLAIAAERLKPRTCSCDLGNAKYLKAPGLQHTTPDDDALPETERDWHSHSCHSDPYVLAQQAAAWADAVLTGRGK